jgi:hypothetical protein
MKRIIKLTEEQLRNIVSKVIKEQSAPITNSDFINNLINAANSGSNKAMDPKGGVNQFTGQKSLNISCVGLKSPQTYKVIKGINGEEFTFFNNGRFKDISDDSMGFYVCGAQSNIVNLTYDSNPKAVKYFNMTPPPVVKPKVKFVPNEVVPLKFGQSGNNIRMIQASLGVKPDGLFYTNTDAAIKKLVPEYNRQTGVTQQIFDKILGVVAKRAPESTITMKDMQNMNISSPAQDVSEDDDIAMLDNLFKKD